MANDSKEQLEVGQRLIVELEAVIDRAKAAARQGNLLTPPWVIDALAAAPSDALAEYRNSVLEEVAAMLAEADPYESTAWNVRLILDDLKTS